MLMASKPKFTSGVVMIIFIYRFILICFLLFYLPLLVYLYFYSTFLCGLVGIFECFGVCFLVGLSVSCWVFCVSR